MDRRGREKLRRDPCGQAQGPFGVCLDPVENDQASGGSGTQDVDEWMAQAQCALEVQWRFVIENTGREPNRARIVSERNLLRERGLTAPGFTHEDAYARRRESVSYGGSVV